MCLVCIKHMHISLFFSSPPYCVNMNNTSCSRELTYWERNTDPIIIYHTHTLISELHSRVSCKGIQGLAIPGDQACGAPRGNSMLAMIGRARLSFRPGFTSISSTNRNSFPFPTLHELYIFVLPSTFRSIFSVTWAKQDPDLYPSCSYIDTQCSREKVKYNRITSLKVK